MTIPILSGEGRVLPCPNVKAAEVTLAQVAPPAGFPHPNDFDRRRIEKTLQARKRYRYVSPHVIATAGGYRIESPCRSRNIDPEGGVIDVALLLYRVDPPGWYLYWKEHARGEWHLDGSFTRLVELLERLNADKDRRFWQ
ncbi:MAG: hypothetical protein ACLQUZ_11800 [Rhizomicrobium sp.]